MRRLNGRGQFEGLLIDVELQLFFESYKDLIQRPSEGIELLEYIIV